MGDNFFNIDLTDLKIPVETYTSLSKCSNYPLFIFLRPKIESKQYPWKNPNTLNYPNKIQ